MIPKDIKEVLLCCLCVAFLPLPSFSRRPRDSESPDSLLDINQPWWRITRWWHSTCHWSHLKTRFFFQIFRRHLAKTWGNKKGRCYWMDEAVVKKYVWNYTDALDTLYTHIFLTSLLGKIFQLSFVMLHGSSNRKREIKKHQFLSSTMTWLKSFHQNEQLRNATKT